MCGIAGILSTPHQENKLDINVKLMSDAIFHRGPNDSGIWINNDAGIALAHRRLSIVDLSEAGHQPMSSESNQFIIVFNGEIYNHNDLRKELLALNPKWRGHSDTETLLAAISAWGIKSAIQKCVGMFAFALWDKQSSTLTLGRDRLGEKPLYYGWQGLGKNAVFLFGSELKALKAHPSFKPEINRDALALMMRYSYVPAPLSIWKGINKLEPGCLLTIQRGNFEPKIDRYWSCRDVVHKSSKFPFPGSKEDVVIELEALLRNGIGQQMLADVPLGAFLSGGIDSSTVVALMQAQSQLPVKTFSIGFNEAQYNEAEHAKTIAKHLGTEHTELYVNAQDAIDVIPKLPIYYDEPFADSSQIPTFLVSQLARQQVTVALSGDGGDELFCGYNRYLMTNSLWNKVSHLPIGLRKNIAKGLTALSPNMWNQLAYPLFNILPNRFSIMNIGDKLYKGANALVCQSSDELYRTLVSHWHDPASLVLGLTEKFRSEITPDLPQTLSQIERMMAWDILTYLPDDILTKIDRAAMSVSLETRVPFLDHRVVEFALSMPLDYKIHNGLGKWALRQVLYKYIPKTLIERPKMGFSVPIAEWLRTSLKEWAENLLDEKRLKNEGFFNAKLVRQKWEEHISEKRNWQSELWNILMFQAWLEHQ